MRVPRDARLSDIDGDGDQDLLVLFVGEIYGGGGTSHSETVEGKGVAVYWNVDNAFLADNYSLVDLTSLAYVIDVAVLRASASNNGLVMLGPDGIWHAALDVATHTFAAPTIIWNVFGASRLEVADFDDDGLDDIAYLIGDSMQLLLQVSARELTKSGDEVQK